LSGIVSEPSQIKILYFDIRGVARKRLRPMIEFLRPIAIRSEATNIRVFQLYYSFGALEENALLYIRKALYKYLLHFTIMMLSFLPSLVYSSR
jgi:hypothetical protein